MSTFKKSKIQIAGKEREVLLINYSNDDTVVESKSVDTMHHIHILDRSYSMSGNIIGLMDDVKKTFREIPVGDYISVIWFSSEGENGVVIKGYKKTENDDFAGIDKLIDSIKNCVGCTCFNEPMELVTSIITEMKPLCPYYNVTLFTDGCSCCSISPKDDYNKSYETIKRFKEDIMALNTLGYGYYYDKDFLTSLAEITDFGKYIHSSNVKEYSEIFSHNYERVKDMVAEKVDIVAEGCEILYLNNKSSRLCKDEIHLSAIDKRKNQFLLILPEVEDGCGITFGPTLNGEDITESIGYFKLNFGKMLDTTLYNLQYALAYESYYKGDRETCLNILMKDLHDKHLIDEQLNAFTIDETSNFLKKLNKAIYNNPSRYQDGEAPDNYLPKDDAFCIMDLLGILCLDGNFYVPNISSYKRIGLQVEDTFNLFEPKRDYEIFAPFNDNLVYNKNKLNISIKFTRDGTVNINPKQAKKVGLPEVIDSKQFQTHTIIKDGHLNLETIRVKLSDKTYSDLRDIEAINNITILKDIGRFDEKVYDIDLTSLPVINRTYLLNSSDINNVFETVMKITKCEANQKVLNWMIAKHPCKEYVGEGYAANKYDTYSEEQIEVLKEHGLNESLTYAGVNRKVTEKNEDDYYEARELEFMIKGCSSLPAIEKALETYETAISKGKTPNITSTLIYEAVDEVNVSLRAYNEGSKEEKECLKKMLKTTKNSLMYFRNNLSAIKLAKVLTGSWWEGLTVEKDKLTYKDPNSDNVLVIKTGYSKVYFN